LGIINASGYFATNLFPDDQLESILANPKDVHDRIIGSVLVILQEQVMLLTLWGVKICAMGFIYRLT
jgi:hypothetical protein